jgi:capsular exopolysaccharide synthesis family protein
MMPVTNSNPTSVSPAIAAPPPSVLAAKPTLLCLLKALRHCWIRATLVGLLAAGAAGAAAWFLIPTSTRTARTLMHVPPGSPYLFGLAEGVPQIGDHQRTQVALVKSRRVLNSALKQPGIGSLDIFKSHPDQIEWLEKELQADFTVAPAVLRISLTGENPDSLSKLVTAVREAYRTEILDKERADRAARLELLGKRHLEYTERLRAKQAREKQLERQGVAKDAGMRSLLQTFTHMQLSWYERELVQTQSSLRRDQIELATLRSFLKDLASSAIPDADIQKLLDADPAVQAAQIQVSTTTNLLEKSAGVLKQGNSDPRLQPLRKQLAEAESALATVKKRLTPDAVQRLRMEQSNTTTNSINRLEVRVSMEVADVKQLATQVDSIRQGIQKAIEDNAQLDLERESTAEMENVTKRIADEVEKLRFEVDTPARFSLLEDTVVYRTTDDKRLVMATAGAFSGVFALVLLAFAFHEFRGRRVGTVEEVVHGLGMSLIGTIPDSARPSSADRADGADVPAHNTLAEAVDATRVMLLRAARSESMRVVMVTSAHSGEGKTSLSTHLAASLAQTGLNTLLIDGDLRNPVVHRLFGLDAAPGFCELLRGEVSATEAVRPAGVERLSVIPAGRWSSGASRALAQDSVLGAVLKQFRETFDFVLIDSSPVLPVVDPLLIGQLVDGTIMSVLRDVSRMPTVYAAHQRLISGGVRVLGAVVNGVRGEVYGAAYPYRQRVG